MNSNTNMHQQLIILCITILFAVPDKIARAQENRWQPDNENGIVWNVKPGESHVDHIEMSGRYLSAVLYYGVNADNSFYFKRDLVWPMLRTIPNDTHASLIRTFDLNYTDLITINHKPIQSEKVKQIRLNGTLTCCSMLNDNIELARTFFPSPSKPAFCELYQLTNKGTKTITVEIPEMNHRMITNADEGVDAVYEFITSSGHSGAFKLAPGHTQLFSLYFTAAVENKAEKDIDVSKELEQRTAFIHDLNTKLILETPDTVLNLAFAFAKLRAAESIFQTKGGPMHAPGGLRYYAAIWANDQAEYINPFFPYLGYDYGVESALNAYLHFAKFINPGFIPIPSSIIAEGTDIWNGAGDRGDAAMIAYGASRFALSQGDIQIAQKLWPLIEWCLEYNHRKLNKKGVVTSDSDELEGRFPSGDANLCTSSLYYDALLSAAYLSDAMHNKTKISKSYRLQAEKLRKAIENYFGAEVMGYQTYRYYKGNDVLRAWICMPLTVGIYDRKAGTIDALFSPELWTADGLASQAGDKTFWDRSTLYALRGVFAAGETKRGLEYLKYYSSRRLLGNHVPYPVEAFPEGNQRHLSAESGLYCRIFTEGLFGIRPVAFNSFSITPSLPEEWDFMNLTHVHGFGREFNIHLKRNSGKINLQVIQEGKTIFNKLIENGSTCTISF